MTICRIMKRHRANRQQGRKATQIEQGDFEEFAEERLGSHKCQGVELLSMKERDREGYYQQLAFVPFAKSDTSCGGRWKQMETDGG